MIDQFIQDHDPIISDGFKTIGQFELLRNRHVIKGTHASRVSPNTCMAPLIQCMALIYEQLTIIFHTSNGAEGCASIIQFFNFDINSSHYSASINY